jgi:hypothetical protein
VSKNDAVLLFLEVPRFQRRSNRKTSEHMTEASGAPQDLHENNGPARMTLYEQFLSRKDTNEYESPLYRLFIFWHVN